MAMCYFAIGNCLSPGLEWDMRRRDFLTALSATAFLAKANAQQPRPVIGFLHQGALPPPSLKAAFRKGLAEVGVSESPDILIEDRAADGQYDRLPALAADLVQTSGDGHSRRFSACCAGRKGRYPVDTDRFPQWQRPDRIRSGVEH